MSNYDGPSSDELIAAYRGHLSHEELLTVLDWWVKHGNVPSPDIPRPVYPRRRSYDHVVKVRPKHDPLLDTLRAMGVWVETP